MSHDVNRTKVLGELFQMKVMLNDFKQRKDFKRLSPATKEVHAMLETAVSACAEAVRSGHPLMFEINVWEQQSLTGWAIDLADSENPIQIE